jgi:c-di-GMP-binding flagellar brake protein YcgR
MPPPPERRENQRVKIQVPVEFYIEGKDTPYRTATSDLSLHGCYIETIFPFPVGTVLELKLQLTGTLLVLATVATSDPQVGNGIKFTRMLPEDVDELRTFLDAAEKAATEKDAAEKEAAQKAAKKESAE